MSAVHIEYDANIGQNFDQAKIKDKKMTIKERILSYINEAGIKKNDFYKATGISASNFKGDGLNSEIGGNKIAKILSIYKNLSPDWLLTGNGPMLKDEISKQTQILQDNGDLNTFNQYPEEAQKSELIKQLMDRISQQAEEIGRLKERIENMKDSNLKSVSDVEEDIAHVG